MPVMLVMPEATVARLLSLSEAPPSLHKDIRDCMQSMPLNHDTPADPSIARQHTTVPHDLLIRVARWARSHDRPDLCLDRLLRGARIYTPPPPKYERPRELDESLKAIRLEQERRTYDAMIHHTAPTDRGATHEERLAWRETRLHISAILNVLLSMAAIAAAVWWGAGSASPLWKVSVALTLSVLIGTAEVVLYTQYGRTVKHSRTKRIVRQQRRRQRRAQLPPS